MSIPAGKLPLPELAQKSTRSRLCTWQPGITPGPRQASGSYRLLLALDERERKRAVRRIADILSWSQCRFGILPTTTIPGRSLGISPLRFSVRRISRPAPGTRSFPRTQTTAAWNFR